MAAQGGGVDHSCIPLYVVACVRAASLAPWRSYSLGMLSDSWSISFLFAPSFASLSHSSFPRLPW